MRGGFITLEGDARPLLCKDPGAAALHDAAFSDRPSKLAAGRMTLKPSDCLSSPPNLRMRSVPTLPLRIS